MLSNSVMEPNSPSKIKIPTTGVVQYHRISKSCRNILLVMTSIAIMSAVAFITLFRVGNSQVALERPFFTVVVDCGSTGTRVNVYKWISRGRSSGRLPVLLHTYPDSRTKNILWKNGCQYHCMQTEPGLDKFLNNASGVRASLQPLINWAEELIPSDRHGETPILVLATAGLRRLHLTDSKVILKAVENVVKEGSFLWNKSWIRVLKGKEEAYYGWVALNYRLGYLGNSSRMGSLGLLDLGGSSLQVVVEANISGNDDNVVNSRIGSIKHHLLAYSLSDFGLNEAFDRTVAMLYQVQLRENITGRSEVRHPCLRSNFQQNYSCINCLLRFSDNLRSLSSRVGKNQSMFISLSGDHDMYQCKRLAMAAAINSSISDWPKLRAYSSCNPDIPSADGGNALNLSIYSYPNERFHALSGFFAIYNMLNLTAKANLMNIREKGEQLCSSSWSDSSAKDYKYRAGNYCFKVLYVASLLEDSLCLGNADIVFGPGDVSWTLGASLVELEHLRPQSGDLSSGISDLQYIEVMPSLVLIFVLLLLLLLLVYACQVKLPMPRSQNKGDVVRGSLPFSRQRP